MQKKIKVLFSSVLFLLLVVAFQNCRGLNSQYVEDVFSSSDSIGNGASEAVYNEKSYPDLRNVIIPLDSIKANSFELQWSPVDGVSEYIVHISDRMEHIENFDCSGPESLYKFEGLTENKLSVKNLRAGFYYFYKVCAIRSGEVLSSQLLYMQTLFDKDVKYKEVIYSNYGVYSSRIRKPNKHQVFLLTEDNHLVHWGQVSDLIKDLKVISALQSEILFHSLENETFVFITKDLKYITIGDYSFIYDFDQNFIADLEEPGTKVIGNHREDLYMILKANVVRVRNGQVEIIGPVLGGMDSSSAEYYGPIGWQSVYKIGDLCLRLSREGIFDLGRELLEQHGAKLSSCPRQYTTTLYSTLVTDTTGKHYALMEGGEFIDLKISDAQGPLFFSDDGSIGYLSKNQSLVVLIKMSDSSFVRTEIKDVGLEIDSVIFGDRFVLIQGKSGIVYRYELFQDRSKGTYSLGDFSEMNQYPYGISLSNFVLRGEDHLFYFDGSNVYYGDFFGIHSINLDTVLLLNSEVKQVQYFPENEFILVRTIEDRLYYIPFGRGNDLPKFTLIEDGIFSPNKVVEKLSDYDYAAAVQYTDKTIEFFGLHEDSINFARRKFLGYKFRKCIFRYCFYIDSLGRPGVKVSDKINISQIPSYSSFDFDRNRRKIKYIDSKSNLYIDGEFIASNIVKTVSSAYQGAYVRLDSSGVASLRFGRDHRILKDIELKDIEDIYGNHSFAILKGKNGLYHYIFIERNLNDMELNPIGQAKILKMLDVNSKMYFLNEVGEVYRVAGYSEVSLELLESGVEDIYVSYHGDGAIFKMKDGRLLTDKVYSHSSAINVIEEYDKLHFIDGKLSAIQIGEEIFGFRYINGFESYGKLINTALKLVNKDVEVDKVIVDYHCRIVSFKEGGYYAKVPVDYTKFKEVYSSKKLRQIQKTANKCYLLTDDNEMIIYSDGDLETRGNHSFSGNVLSGVVQINLSGGEIEVTKVNGDKILLPD